MLFNIYIKLLRDRSRDMGRVANSSLKIPGDMGVIPVGGVR